MPVTITVTPTPSNGSTIPVGGPWSAACSASDSGGHTILFQPQGNDWTSSSACYITVTVNGTLQGFVSAKLGTTVVYDSDYSALSTPRTATGYSVTDTASTHSSGTVTLNATTPWPPSAAVVIRIFLNGRDQSTFANTGFSPPGGQYAYTVAPNLVIATTSSAENTALAGDLPFLVGNNVIEAYAAMPAWSQGNATWASYTDVTDPNLPTRLIFDRQSIAQSGPVLAAVTTYTLLMSVTYSSLTDGLHSFDTFCLLNHNLGTCASGGTAITLTLSDSTDFTASVSTPILVQPVTSNARILVTNLNGTHNRYAGITYVRLIVTASTGNFTAAPLIGEVIMGRRRQLSYFPDVPFEDKGSVSDVTDHVARSGTRSRYVRNYGARRLEWTLRSAGADKNGLNQENEVRAWFRECKWGTQPSLVVQRPQSSPMPLYMFPEQALLEMPIYGPYERAFKMTMVEQPVYWQTEEASLNVYPV